MTGEVILLRYYGCHGYLCYGMVVAMVILLGDLGEGKCEGWNVVSDVVQGMPTTTTYVKDDNNNKGQQQQ